MSKIYSCDSIETRYNVFSWQSNEIYARHRIYHFSKQLITLSSYFTLRAQLLANNKTIEEENGGRFGFKCWEDNRKEKQFPANWIVEEGDPLFAELETLLSIPLVNPSTGIPFLRSISPILSRLLSDNNNLFFF